MKNLTIKFLTFFLWWIGEGFGRRKSSKDTSVMETECSVGFTVKWCLPAKNFFPGNNRKVIRHEKNHVRVCGEEKEERVKRCEEKVAIGLSSGALARK